MVSVLERRGLHSRRLAPVGRHSRPGRRDADRTLLHRRRILKGGEMRLLGGRRRLRAAVIRGRRRRPLEIGFGRVDRRGLRGGGRDGIVDVHVRLRQRLLIGNGREVGRRRHGGHGRRRGERRQLVQIVRGRGEPFGGRRAGTPHEGSQRGGEEAPRRIGEQWIDRSLPRLRRGARSAKRRIGRGARARLRGPVAGGSVGRQSLRGGGADTGDARGDRAETIARDVGGWR